MCAIIIIAVSLYRTTNSKNPFSSVAKSRHLSATHCDRNITCTHTDTRTAHILNNIHHHHRLFVFCISLFRSVACGSIHLCLIPSFATRDSFNYVLFARMVCPPIIKTVPIHNLCETISSNCWSERGHIDSNGKKIIVKPFDLRERKRVVLVRYACVKSNCINSTNI